MKRRSTNASIIVRLTPVLWNKLLALADQCNISTGCDERVRIEHYALEIIEAFVAERADHAKIPQTQTANSRA